MLPQLLSVGSVALQVWPLPKLTTEVQAGGVSAVLPELTAGLVQAHRHRKAPDMRQSTELIVFMHVNGSVTWLRVHIFKRQHGIRQQHCLIWEH